MCAGQSAYSRSRSRRFSSLITFSALFLPAVPAFAQMPGGGSQSPIGLVVALGLLALLPFLLIMVTSFVKVAVVLSLLRTAIGAQQVPPNQVITGLAIVLSIYIMAPVGMQIYTEVEPMVAQMEETEERPGFDEYRDLAKRTAAPLKSFLNKHAHPMEKQLLYELARELRPPDQREGLEQSDLIVAVPAFVVSELKEAFTIGFILFVPFIVIDMVIANILLSLGMHMLSPTTISLPFKLLLFVLVDGWFLVVKGLVLGYV
ncbi:EscR/YscR/HrcR family type III secretion system export apparatus protein [Persicimonas caeni]|uniref:EscR/YscR/HrcR family type III secretion system export apparatus protein n=1 Tax=Persicimonas caeni TaxID=2292766 RepID=A0A4Y6PTN0_PERCE|nr:type III secretion system export apparatus subunit SctR [Persicimonas caeni]QDG51658.1 EscR/YscR/HrcR family type III secretion system export apparatus protein [Persicimonas caeni]QED32879.1 EscR/YscR/HrcR family type III secretion system export apparatus protein [Persicimonas caeni]